MAIIRNLTASPIELNDMGGVTIPANGDFDLKTTPQEEIDTSIDLANAIATGNIVYLAADGTELSQVDSQTILESAAAPEPSATKLSKYAGFEDASSTTLTFSKQTGTATLSPVGSPGSFVIWSHGSKYTFTQPLTLVFPLDTTARVLYFDDNGNFVSIPTPVDSDPIWRNDCLVAEAVFNVSAGTYRGMFDLRFGVDVDTALRQNILMTHGAIYNNGLGIENILVGGNGSTDVEAQISVADGTITMVDVEINTVDFSQSLAPPAQIQVGYLLGNERKVKPPNDFPLIYQGSVGGDYTGTRLAYNSIDKTGLGALVEMQEGWYTIIHIMMGMGTVSPMTAFIADDEYVSLESAQKDMIFSLQKILSNRIQRRYFVPIGSLIVQTKNEFANTPKAVFHPMGFGGLYHDHREYKEPLMNPPVNFAFTDKQFNIFGDTEKRLTFDLTTGINHNTTENIITWSPGESDVDFNLVPQYSVIAPAAEAIQQFAQVGMNVNGDIQNNPSLGTDSSSEFTTRIVLENSMEYISQNTGVVSYSDATANTIFFKVGQLGQTGITWGAEENISLNGSVVDIHATKIDTARCAFCIVQDNGECIIATISYSGLTIIVEDTILLNDTNVTNADLSYNTYPHLVVGYVNGGTVKNQYYTVSSSGILNSPYSTPQTMNAPSAVDTVQVTSEEDNIIVLIKKGNEVHVAESQWRRQFGTGRYYNHSTSRQITDSTYIGIRGIAATGSKIFLQTELATTGNCQSYYCSYTSGSSVSSETLFGIEYPCLIANLLQSSTGAVFSIILNPSRVLEVYEANTTNISAGYKIYIGGSIPLVSSTNYYDIAATFFEASFAAMVRGDSDISNDVNFLNPATDNFLGVAATTVAQGEDVEVLLGLPIINHSVEYTPGTIIDYGPYTYQAISKHQLIQKTGGAGSYGQNFEYAEALPLVTTTSTTFQNALTLTSADLPPGTYRIGLSYFWGHSSTSNNFEARLMIDTVLKNATHIQMPQSTSTTQLNSAARTYYVDFTTAATHTFDVEYRTGSGHTARISEIVLELWRVT